jgi:selenocysteine lyase/cysteine desulfurase
MISSAVQLSRGMLCVPTYKWLLGPYSMGFLYAAPNRREGRPLEANWINREGSENFAGLVQYRDTFQAGARRYDVGEHSNFGLMPVTMVALRQILEWGVPEIASTLAELTAKIAAEAYRLGLEAPPAQFRAPHLIGLRSKSTFSPDLPERLGAEGIFVSVRGSSIRVSPHLYNTSRDVDRLFSVLAESV